MQAIEPIFNFTRLVIIEPMVSAEGPAHLSPLRDELVARALQRTNAWPTREVARQVVATRKWDPRVVDAFVVRPWLLILVVHTCHEIYQKHGVYWNADVNAFTLCCSREQEIVSDPKNDVDINVLDCIRECIWMSKVRQNLSKS